MTVAEKFSNLGIDNAPGQESLQKSTVLEFRRFLELQLIFHTVMSMHMSRFPAALKCLQKVSKRAVPRPIRPIGGKKAYWSMWQPIYQPLQGFRLIRMRI